MRSVCAAFLLSVSHCRGSMLDCKPLNLHEMEPHFREVPLRGGKKRHRIKKNIEPPEEPHRPRVRGSPGPKDRPRSVS